MKKSLRSNKLLITVFTLAITAAATIATAQDKGGLLRLEKGISSSPTRNQQAQQTLQLPRLITDFGAGINVAVPGHAATHRAAIFDQLLNVTIESPTWPAFPRIWYEESLLETVDTSTYWSPIVKVLNGGIELDYKYGVKTSLVMMSSLHKQNAASGTATEAAAYQMVYSDPKTKRVYPKLRPGYPMVGFCSFEVQLTISAGQTLGIEVFGAGVKRKSSQIRTVQHTVFSKFFPIPANLPIQSIMNKYCSDTFANHVRAYTESNFVPIVIEEAFWHSPRNQCQPNEKDSAEGDFDCLKWFAGFDRHRQRTSVPRCETLKGGFNVCRLKAKEAQRCPIYQDKAGNRFNTVVKTGLREYTRAKNAFPCDKGLTCKVTQPPVTTLFGAISLPGESFCSK